MLLSEGAVNSAGTSGGVHHLVAMLPCEVGPCVLLVVCVFASAVFAVFDGGFLWSHHGKDKHFIKECNS